MRRAAPAPERLLVALQGDRVRFASQMCPGAPLQAQASYASADFETLWDAIYHHLWRQRLDGPSECVLVLPGPVSGDEIRPGPSPWAFSARALRNDLGLRRLLLICDPDSGAGDWQHAALLALDQEALGAHA